MKDNFSMHEWLLNEKIKGIDGKPCWKGYRYAGTENGKDKCVPVKEMDEATFTSKHDDNPKLKGGQKDLPDEVQAKIVAENDTPKHKIIAQLMGPDFFLSKKNERNWDDKDHDLFNRIMKMASEEGKVPKLNENEDHEVSMAQASLKSIISSASQLMNKLGNDERNIPGWIQDHIVNAENYIDQANQGFHELDNEYEED
jgi:hypothetical protein